MQHCRTSTGYFDLQLSCPGILKSFPVAYDMFLGSLYLGEGNGREGVKRKRTTRGKQLLPLFDVICKLRHPKVPRLPDPSVHYISHKKPTGSVCCETPNTSAAFITCSSSKHLIFTRRQPVIFSFCPEYVFGNSSSREPSMLIPRDTSKAQQWSSQPGRLFGTLRHRLQNDSAF